MSRILVPMDFSNEAYLAMDWAAKLVAEKPGSFLHLVHVLPFTGDSEEERKKREAARRRMQDLRSTLPTDLAIVPSFPSGRVAEEIAAICREEHIDLVVMTTHGRFGAEHNLKGSITEDTVRITPCPVLVLHLNQATAEHVRERFVGFLPEPDDNPPL